MLFNLLKMPQWRKWKYAMDLKSIGIKIPCRFEPGLRYNLLKLTYRVM